jgi:hypothetical protein
MEIKGKNQGQLTKQEHNLYALETKKDTVLTYEKNLGFIIFYFCH